MLNGGVVHMEMTKINPGFHLQFLIGVIFCVLFSSNKFWAMILLMMIVHLFIFYHHIRFREVWRPFPFLTILFILAIGSYYFMPAFLQLFIRLFCQLSILWCMIHYYIYSQDTMTLFYGLDCVLAPLTYFRLPSTELAWKITSFFRNIGIFYQEWINIRKKVNRTGISFQWKAICDKIDRTNELIKRAKRVTLFRVKQLDDMMYLRLFRHNVSRNNYHVPSWKLFDFIFIILLMIVLVSEVIL